MKGSSCPFSHNIDISIPDNDSSMNQLEEMKKKQAEELRQLQEERKKEEERLARLRAEKDNVQRENRNKQQQQEAQKMKDRRIK